ncbi:MAG: M48 family metalloprotease [Schwartzia sp.]|nr:M48 family metalloprotease [Schwartzia sp. (in: firmicutes)]
MMNNKNMKKLAAAAFTALTLSAPLSAEAHFLSSRQEKEIGNQAVADFQAEYATFEDPILTHIQDRIMKFNSDKLWFYGAPGHKRGLERVLRARRDEINAISYGGGQIFVYDGEFDLLACRELGQAYSDKSWQNPWRKSDIYQMSSMAAVVGHEIGHWENEDMLRMHDKQMGTRILVSLIPVGNVWAALGVAAGANLINAFNSRQMGFETEQEADEKAMEYCERVPEYSIGGQAICEYRDYQFKVARGIENHVNWLHPHSKSQKRLERALKEQEKQSHGFFVWKGINVSIDERDQENTMAFDESGYYGKEREFYVFGQLATSIKYDFCRERNIEFHPENEVFADGSARNTVALMRGRGTDRKEHVKLIDTYRNTSAQQLKSILAMTPSEAIEKQNKMTTEQRNFVAVRCSVAWYEQNRMKYKYNQKYMEEEPAEEA